MPTLCCHRNGCVLVLLSPCHSLLFEHDLELSQLDRPGRRCVGHDLGCQLTAFGCIAAFATRRPHLRLSNILRAFSDPVAIRIFSPCLRIGVALPIRAVHATSSDNLFRFYTTLKPAPLHYARRTCRTGLNQGLGEGAGALLTVENTCLVAVVIFGGWN